MEENKKTEQQARKRKLGRKGKGGGMTGGIDLTAPGSVPYVIDPESGMKVFIKTIEMGKDGIQTVDKKAKGGRAGFKSGMSVCKLAKRGKGKAYGKNS